jgi:hypothetical protein
MGYEEQAPDWGASRPARVRGAGLGGGLRGAAAGASPVACAAPRAPAGQAAAAAAAPAAAPATLSLHPVAALTRLRLLPHKRRVPRACRRSTRIQYGGILRACRRAPTSSASRRKSHISTAIHPRALQSLACGDESL